MSGSKAYANCSVFWNAVWLKYSNLLLRYENRKPDQFSFEPLFCIAETNQESVSRLQIDRREAVPGEDHEPNLPGKIILCQEVWNGIFLYIMEAHRTGWSSLASLAYQQSNTVSSTTEQYYRYNLQSRKTYLGIKLYLKIRIYATVSESSRDRTLSTLLLLFQAKQGS